MAGVEVGVVDEPDGGAECGVGGDGAGLDVHDAAKGGADGTKGDDGEGWAGDAVEGPGGGELAGGEEADVGVIEDGEVGDDEAAGEFVGGSLARRGVFRGGRFRGGEVVARLVRGCAEARVRAVGEGARGAFGGGRRRGGGAGSAESWRVMPGRVSAARSAARRMMAQRGSMRRGFRPELSPGRPCQRAVLETRGGSGGRARGRGGRR